MAAPQASVASLSAGDSMPRRLAARWQTLAPRERAFATAAALAVALALVWAIAVQPAWRALREAPAQIDRLDASLDRMRALAAEARSMRDIAPLPIAQAATGLRSATDALGERGKLSIQGERATLTVTDLPFDALRGWLAEARSAARARPVEAELSRGARGYGGKLVVHLESPR